MEEIKKTSTELGTRKLQTMLKMEVQEKQLKSQKKIMSVLQGLLLTALLLCGAFVVGIILIIFNNVSAITEIGKESAEKYEATRVSMLQGLYSITRAIETNIPTREKRLEIHAKQAKAVVLQWSPETDLSDDEMDRMIIANFKLSELYMISPWEFMAYAAVESGFIKTAESPTGALGIVQFLPSTMRIILGTEYVPGMEFDPVWSVKAWYKYWLIINEATGGSRTWTAATYCTGNLALRALNTGMDLTEYMDWITQKQLNDPEFPFKIEKVFSEFSTFGYVNLSN